MPNLMQRGTTWLGTKLQSAAGRSIVYMQGGVPYPLTATPTTKDYEVIGDDGMPTVVSRWDFIITSSELAVTPRTGDRITETLNSSTVTYEVLPISETKPCCEALDNSAILLLVHTKKVG